jgi:4-hydroxybenzoate polyprenyltransferase
MIIPASLAASRYHGGNPIAFVLTFFCLSPLLWSAGYILNDITDVDLDVDHSHRSKRPMSSGNLSVHAAYRAITVLSISALLLSIVVSWYITVFAVILALNEILYTVKPYRLKERPIVDILNNILNSVIRSLAAWYSQTSNSPTQIVSIIAMLAAIKLILFIGHRYQNRLFEIKHKISSSVTILPKWVLFMLIIFLLGTIGINSLYIFVHQIIPLSAIPMSFIGCVPILWYVLRRRTLGILEQEKTGSFRTLLYLTIFLIGNGVALSIFFPFF